MELSRTIFFLLSVDPLQPLEPQSGYFVMEIYAGFGPKFKKSSSRNAGDHVEGIRQRLLSDTMAMRQLGQTNPELASAALSNSAEFKRLFENLEKIRRDADQQRMNEMHALENADPFDQNAQQKIEDAIRNQNVQENMEHAMEYHPEAFGRVTMLYIDVEVAGQNIKAFVDSGAQATIMSPECAETCGLMRLLDSRFSGIAHGVGTAKILGRVHSAPIKVGTQYLPCSFTVMEGKGVDLLFGLDMLKRHQAIIDLKSNCLRINAEEVRFLSEHELPDKARWDGEKPPGDDEKAKGKEPLPMASASTASKPTIGSSSTPSSKPSPAQSKQPDHNARPQLSTTAPAAFPESDITTIMSLGVTRQEAIHALEMAGGNADIAASILFQ